MRTDTTAAPVEPGPAIARSVARSLPAIFAHEPHSATWLGRVVSPATHPA